MSRRSRRCRATRSSRGVDATSRRTACTCSCRPPGAVPACRASPPPTRVERLRRVQLVDERPSVERLVAEPRRDLLARRPGPLEEERAQELPGLPAPPPVLADLRDEVGTELR